MKIFNLVKTKFFSQEDSERGQSLVLIALVLIALLGFVGLAVDVGFVFARGSQLQAAVDSAALSAVSEVTSDLVTTAADLKVQQFLNANDVPISNTLGITFTTAASRSDDLGIVEYTVVVTRPVELFFLQLLRPEPVTLARSATAAVNTLTDIYASRNVEEGIIKISTQGVFGPQACTDYGDPFSPWNSVYAPGPYTYTYRIMIPSSYPEKIVRVELFDPDSINNNDVFVNIAHSSNAVNHPEIQFPLTDIKTCGTHGGSKWQRDPCVLRTEELTLTTPVMVSTTYNLDQVNPYWFVRIDENRGAGPAADNGNGTCAAPVDPSDPKKPIYVSGYNTQTVFSLYYLRETPDGQTIRTPIASYWGNTGDGRPGDAVHNTDMHWVSPGADKQGKNYPYPVPEVDGVSEVPTREGNTSFEVNLDTDVPDIITSQGSGTRYLYLDVTSNSGSSENGFHIWAGPNYYLAEVSANVNERNIHALNNPGSHHSKGVVIFALGNLPMNSMYKIPQGNIDDGILPGVVIPLIYVGPERAGTDIQVRLFDTDSGAEGPVEFFFDTIPEGDWSLSFSNPNGIPPDPDGELLRCIIGAMPEETAGCKNKWADPAYNLTVPGILDNCDYDNLTQEDCTPFYGGRLMVRYKGGLYDSFGWEISIEGLPYLVR